MNRPNDIRIETFRQTVERLDLIHGQLQTLEITLARALELPGLMQNCSCRLDLAQLREEQSAIGHPATHRIRQIQLERELRQGWPAAVEQLRSATDAATIQVTTAAGGTEAARALPFARRHLEKLAKYHDVPTIASTAVRLGFLRQAWMAIDAALAALNEIRFDVRKRENRI